MKWLPKGALEHDQNAYLHKNSYAKDNVVVNKVRSA